MIRVSQRLNNAVSKEANVNVISVASLHLAIVVFRHKLLAACEWGGPVHEVQVKVVGLQIFERGINGRLDIVGVVAIVPELGRDKYFMARHTAVLDTAGYCGLRTIAVMNVNAVE